MAALSLGAIAIVVVILIVGFLAVVIAWGASAAREGRDSLPKRGRGIRRVAGWDSLHRRRNPNGEVTADRRVLEPLACCTPQGLRGRTQG